MARVHHQPRKGQQHLPAQRPRCKHAHTTAQGQAHKPRGGMGWHGTTNQVAYLRTIGEQSWHAGTAHTHSASSYSAREAGRAGSDRPSKETGAPVRVGGDMVFGARETCGVDTGGGRPPLTLPLAPNTDAGETLPLPVSTATEGCPDSDGMRGR